MYGIPTECGVVYIGQTECSTQMRIKEHHWHIRLYDLDKSATAEHSINLVTTPNFKTLVS